MLLLFLFENPPHSTTPSTTIHSTYTERFIMFSVITNIYNKKTKGLTLMELFTTTGKMKFFLQLEMFDVCTTAAMIRA
jgi:hypothetical protein